MTQSCATIKSNNIAGMRYRDSAGATQWLCKTFGFEKHLVAPGEDGTIDHARLTLGNRMIMLGSPGDDEFERWKQVSLGYDVASKIRVRRPEKTGEPLAF